MYRTCSEFLEEARRLRHPFDGTGAVGDDVLNSVFEVLAKGSEFVKK